MRHAELKLLVSILQSVPHSRVYEWNKCHVWRKLSNLDWVSQRQMHQFKLNDTCTSQASYRVLSKTEKASCVFIVHKSHNSTEPLSVAPEYLWKMRGNRTNSIQGSCFLALLQLTCCFWAPLEDAWVIKQRNTQQWVQDAEAWWDLKKKQLKSMSPLHHPVHDTNDLGGFKMCHSNFNMYCKAAVDVTDTQLIASFLS